MLAYIHIPRTGGRILFDMFVSAFGEKFVGYFYPPAPGPLSLPHNYYHRMYEHFGGVKCLSSNIIRPNNIMEKQWGKITYFTILRHPIDRLLSSYLAHFRRYGLHQHSLPYYLVDKLKTIDEYAIQIENQNFLTRFFSESDNSEKMSTKHFTKAKKTIQNIDIIGVTERIEFPLRKLYKQYKQFKKSNPKQLLKGGKRYRDSIHKSILKRLIALNEMDMELYSYVNELS